LIKMREFGTVISGNRGRKGELSKEARAAICALAEAGVAKKDLAEQFGCHRNTVTYTINRFNATEKNASRPRKGRPQILNSVETRYIITLVKRNPRIAWKALLASTPRRVSQSTLRRVMGKEYRRKWRALKRIALTKKRAKARFAWARIWYNRTAELRAVSPQRETL
jgi:transposase